MPEPRDVTTLQLAELIARALHDDFPDFDAMTQSVMRTMREHGCWFCRLDRSGPLGETVVTQMELFNVER